MKRLYLLSTIFLTLSILALTACSKSKDTILIGTAAPMTGQSAKMGEDISQGVQLAVDEWNAQGGIAGRKVELMIEDDRADPKDAVSVANKFAAMGAVGVVGHYNSSCTIPASNIYHENNIIMITPASTNPMVTDRGYPEVFRTCGRDDQQGAVEAEFAVNVLKAGRIVVLHDKTTYGQGLADEFKKNLPDTVSVVLYDGIAVGDKDFSAILTRAKAGSPDLLMFGGLYAEGGLIVKQMRDLELNCAFLSGDGVYDPEFIRIAGKAAEGAYVSYARSPEKIPTAQKFLSAYRARFQEVGPYSLYAYDAANILLTAIRETGVTDGAALAAYIHTNKFEGGVGVYEFDQKGDPIYSPYVIWKVVNGRLTQLEESAPSQGISDDTKEFQPLDAARTPGEPQRVETH